MKNFLRVGVPVVIVFGVVFIITLAQRYTTDGDDPLQGMSNVGPAKPLKAREVPLQFFTLQAVSGYSDPAASKPHLKYWNPSVEVGQYGSLEYLCVNKNDKPVKVNVARASCTCVGTHLGIVPPPAWHQYQRASILTAGPFAPASPLLAVAAHLELNKATQWDTLRSPAENSKEIIDNTISIPPTDPKYGPQVAFFRLGWTGKSPPEPKVISAEVYAQLPDGMLNNTKVEAHISTVTAFAIFRRDSAAGFAISPDLTLDDLREGGVTSREIFLISATRQHPVYTASFGDSNDWCVTVSEPKPASEEDLKNFEAYVAADSKAVKAIKSVYKAIVTIRERSERTVEGQKQMKQLDLGVLERRLKISSLNDNTEPSEHTISVRCRVYGELAIIAGAESGRIELGNSFPASEDRSKDIVILAERPGLDITWVEKETNPSYLKVLVEPMAPLEGRKRWRVRVTVPKGKLFSALPANSAIVITTNDPMPRRILIPVRGMAADTGSRPDL